VVGLSVVLVPLAYGSARHLAEGLLLPSVLPIVLPGVAAALASGWALLRRKWRLARVTVVAQVVFLLAGWGAAQNPFLIYPDVTLHDAAAPKETLTFLLTTLPFGAALLGPSLWFLLRVFKRAKERRETENEGGD
jgi:cytochrome d ubiquinol oxidase subunit II